jgi:hypothetical protein
MAGFLLSGGALRAYKLPAMHWVLSCRRVRMLPASLRWLAASLPLLLLVLSGLAVRPDLHHALHAATSGESPSSSAHPHHSHPAHDSDPAEQGCAIHLFSSGAVYSACAPAEFLVRTVTIGLDGTDTGGFFPREIILFQPPGRAPPCLVLLG